MGWHFDWEKRTWGPGREESISFWCRGFERSTQIVEVNIGESYYVSELVWRGINGLKIFYSVV